MERQARLRGVESVGELADAALAFAEELDDLEPGLVGQRVEQVDRAGGFRLDRRSHGHNISRNLVMSRALRADLSDAQIPPQRQLVLEVIEAGKQQPVSVMNDSGPNQDAHSKHESAVGEWVHLDSGGEKSLLDSRFRTDQRA